MSFQPIVPFGGNAGLAFLNRTLGVQQEAFNRSPEIARETNRFEDEISGIRTAEALVSDRRLLAVALGAFGLDEDIDNRFFIRKVLEEGTTAPDTLANRLADKRYAAMSKAFGFDLSPPNTVLSDFGTKITSAYRERQFEVALGETAPDMRVALGFSREIEALAGRDISEDGLWFTVMATPPLRTVFESAFRLPPSLGALDVDRQLTILKDRARAFFGDDSVRQFLSPDKQDDLIRQYVAATEFQAGPTLTTPGATALALLTSSTAAGQLLP